MDVGRIRELRESTTPWQMSLRDTPPRCDPARLYRVLLIVSPGANTIRYMQPIAGEPSDEALRAALHAAMLPSPRNPLPAARPPAVWVDDDELAKRLAAPLKECGIALEVARELEAIDPVLEALGRQDNLFSSLPRAVAPTEAEATAPAAPVDDDDLTPSIISVDHAVSIATLTPAMLEEVAPPLAEVRPARALVLHCADEHARPIVQALSELGQIAFVRFREGERDFEAVLGLCDDELLGTLTVCPITHDRPPLSEQFLAGDPLWLVVATGPPGRLRLHEIVHAQQVSLRAPDQAIR